jgi:hypothetical protein
MKIRIKGRENGDDRDIDLDLDMRDNAEVLIDGRSPRDIRSLADDLEDIADSLFALISNLRS